MKFEKYEDLFRFYCKLSEKYGADQVIYKLKKLIEHRTELERRFGDHKGLEELDELLRKNILRKNE